MGHTVCSRCSARVLDVIAWKTNGLCASCFREHAGAIINGALVVVAGRERIVIRTDASRRKPGVRAQRARARKRKRDNPDIKDHRREVAACAERARRRLQRLFPEIWEILLADERAKANLNAFTIDRCLTPGQLQSSLDSLADYRRLEAS